MILMAVDQQLLTPAPPDVRCKPASTVGLVARSHAPSPATGAPLGLLKFSLDPEYDFPPKALSRLREEYGADVHPILLASARAAGADTVKRVTLLGDHISGAAPSRDKNGPLMEACFSRKDHVQGATSWTAPAPMDFSADGVARLAAHAGGLASLQFQRLARVRRARHHPFAMC